MPRSTFTVPYYQSFQQTETTINNILGSQGYCSHDLHGESVWKKGTGLLTAIHYIKIEYSEKDVTISGWVQTGMGNIEMSKEMDLNGFFGVIPKSSVKKVIDQIINSI